MDGLWREIEKRNQDALESLHESAVEAHKATKAKVRNAGESVNYLNLLKDYGQMKVTMRIILIIEMTHEFNVCN
jgi:hypothetical protein